MVRCSFSGLRINVREDNMSISITIRKEEENDYIQTYEVNKLAFQHENEGKLIENIRKSENFIPGVSKKRDRI